MFLDVTEGGGYREGNPTPSYLDPLDPCGDGNCNDEPGYLEETCVNCPSDCTCR